MKTLRIALAALATILAMGINSNTYAFMAIETAQPADVQMNLSDMVDSLREEIAVGETSCEDMLAKLDAALEDIDAKLDAGVANEEEYIAARDAITDMRYDLECLANNLTGFGQHHGGHHGGGGSHGGSGLFGGSGPFSGGGSAAAGSGGGSLGGLAAVGGIIGGTVAVSSSNDDSNAGFVASESFSFSSN